jgi:hypothetical protein
MNKTSTNQVLTQESLTDESQIIVEESRSPSKLSEKKSEKQVSGLNPTQNESED